eukprot:1106880-Pelagomonas_calceolata.AAC.3
MDRPTVLPLLAPAAPPPTPRPPMPECGEALRWPGPSRVAPLPAVLAAGVGEVSFLQPAGSVAEEDVTEYAGEPSFLGGCVSQRLQGRLSSRRQHREGRCASQSMQARPPSCRQHAVRERDCALQGGLARAATRSGLAR